MSVPVVDIQSATKRRTSPLDRVRADLNWGLLGALSRVVGAQRLWGKVYDLGIRINNDCLFINYGITGQYPELDPRFEAERLPAQMYLHVAGMTPLGGRDVVEVGCGRGGGSLLMSIHGAPRSIVALDLSRGQIDFNRGNAVFRDHPIAFQVGDAEQLPLPDGCADVVVNVESSHCYGDIGRFFAEAARVLRPGGSLVFADFRQTHAWDAVISTMVEAGFRVVRSDDLTRRVADSLRADSERKRRIVERDVKTSTAFTLFYRVLGRAMLGGEDTLTFRAFDRGLTTYRSYLLRKD